MFIGNKEQSDKFVCICDYCIEVNITTFVPGLWEHTKCSENVKLTWLLLCKATKIGWKGKNKVFNDLVDFCKIILKVKGNFGIDSLFLFICNFIDLVDFCKIILKVKGNSGIDSLFLYICNFRRI